jgi:DNA polymerase (family 10)
MAMTKWQVARLLDELAKYIELTDTNPFKARAFEKAARKVESLEEDLEALVASGDLYKTPGIGKGIGPVITELVETGTSSYLEEQRAQFPPGIFDLLRVPGLGLKKIGMLYADLGIANIDELEEACRAGRLAKLKGFGAKTEQKILGGIEFARRHESSYLLSTALEVAEPLRELLLQIDGIEDARVVGSVRRRLEVIHNLNVAVAVRDLDEAIEAIGEAGVIGELELASPTTLRGRARNEMRVLIHLTTPDAFGLLLFATTGSEEFVGAVLTKAAKSGLTLVEGGATKNGKSVTLRTEEQLFEAAGVAWVEPELRETAAAVASTKRVALIERSDLRGTFHVHTTWSDGRGTVAEMLEAARERKFSYVGISDHSKTAGYAGGLTEERLVQQQAEIDGYKKQFAPMRIFKGTEADILADGEMDYDTPVLRKFDFVIASVHSRFNMPKDEMTARMLRALANPFVTFLGHITGRLLLSREGYSIDFNQVFDTAAANGVMIEINGNPHRLELDWRVIRNALDRGVRFSIHPDAHATRELDFVLSGTWVARKAGLGPAEIFNTKSVEEVEAHFTARRARAEKLLGA